MHVSPGFDTTRLCRQLSLGDPVAEPASVAGGRLHRMWRIETVSGVFAVKELDPEIVARPGVRDVYRATERVARSAAERGLPTVTALRVEGEVLFEIGVAALLVFPWCQGSSRAGDEIAAADAQRIGQVLGGLHAARIDGTGLGDGGAACPTASDWSSLLVSAAAAGHAWARAGGADVLDATRLALTGAAALPAERVISHRDLDTKNVLWGAASEPWAIDWESAGPISPLVDLVTVALDWSGQAAGPPDRRVFAAVIDGYGTVAPRPPGAAGDALCARLGGWLGWLRYNARRALGETGADTEGRALGLREANAAAATLRRLVDGIDTWSGWLD